ncbi:MAG: sulfur oxidation c-type cytochrome SoxX [Minwuia sp.]|uniref:sulfur oxidation c-type cytochrome SoxX n=1 Tax=Minwuia sp. TaxID=2493630 RepID=UPI003A896DBA
MVKARILVIAAALGAAGLASAAWAESKVAPDDVKLTDDLTVPAMLTDSAGDPAASRAAFLDRKQGNCLACHMNSDMATEPFHGEVGPPLDGAGSRWEPAQIRAIIVNPKKVFGDQTIMPAFYRVSGFNRTGKDFKGETILTAQQVEDIVAYITTLKE